MTTPCPGGEPVADCMKRALAAADREAGQIDLISAHGSATVQNGENEAAAIRSVFGENPPAIHTLKQLTGHSLGAASALEMVALTAALSRQVKLIPHDSLDPAFGLSPRPLPDSLQRILTNAFGFGGINCSLVLECADHS